MSTTKAKTTKTETTSIAAPREPASLVARLGARYGVDGGKLYSCLRDTAFKGRGGAAVTDAQMMALMIVADQYKLNPFTKEIFAFPDKDNGIVPVVGVDGWARIVNEHPAYDGVSFEDVEGESVTCTIYRKDRAHPTVVTEYLSECKRNTSPWGSHPMRMLRHKAWIQCARLAFGFAGIYDQDEAERILLAQDVGPGGKPAVVMPTRKVDRIAEPEVIEAEGGDDDGRGTGSPELTSDAEELPFD